MRSIVVPEKKEPSYCYRVKIDPRSSSTAERCDARASGSVASQMYARVDEEGFDACTRLHWNLYCGREIDFHVFSVETPENTRWKRFHGVARAVNIWGRRMGCLNRGGRSLAMNCSCFGKHFAIIF